ncbi:MAG TPA: DUF4011 domain-containing protein [Streptosporangiaceae bacterium]|nr:DUF4011 domain-containing protein [Streptosporangiaceae bacterium]
MRISLVDFTTANPLLNYAPGMADLVEVSRPAPADVLARLARGGSFAFRSLKPWPAEAEPGAGPQAQLADGAGDGEADGSERPATPGAIPPPAPYILDTNMDPDDLDTALRALMSHSNQQYLERGLPVLYLTFGTLTWTDGDQTRYRSPLLLVPVRLVATEPRQPPMLEPADGDPIMNPALTLSLAHHRITLPQVEDPAEIKLNGLLDAVRAAVATRDDWPVSESLALSCFPAMKEAMYRDLLDHEDQVAAHPAVRALTAGLLRRAGHPDADIAGNGAGASPAREAPALVLAADSTQRACITAALAGRSFTIDGPPGTGKSQTIANMIGALLRAGKTTLFVSEKAAALDVVASRLADAGLDDCLLELHSHKATRAAVAASLDKALDRARTAAGEVPPAENSGPQMRRAHLDAYAQAMNRVRNPLGYSLHDVLMMTASKHEVPAAPATGLAPANLTVGVLHEARRAAADLAACWRPATQGQAFGWRGVTERGPLDDRLYQAASALESLARVARPNQLLADATGLTRPSDAPALTRLLDHLLSWPEGLPDEWLTSETFDVLDVAVAQLVVTLTAITERESQASEAAGVDWPAIPRPDTLPVVDMGALTTLDPACPDLSHMTESQINGLAQQFSAAADRLDDWHNALARLAGSLGLHSPETFTDANDLLSLARLAAESDRPERAWLSVAGYRAASNAAQIIYDAHRTLAQAEAEASAYFTPDALRLNVGGLAQRFANDYRGLGKLSGEYRADRKTVAAFTRPGVGEERALQHLGLAAAWQYAAQALDVAEVSHAALLGPHYAGRATDFARLGRALSTAATALRCARGQGLSRAADYICVDTAPNPGMASVAEEFRRELSAWQSGHAPSPTALPPELLNGAVTAAIRWLRAHLDPLHTASEVTRTVSRAVGRQLTVGQAHHLMSLREAAEEANAQLAARDAVFREHFGRQYAGAATNFRALRDGVEWARQLRVMITGGLAPLTPDYLNAAESAVPTERLPEAARAWREACAALLSAFSPDRRTELAAELDDYEGGNRLLEALFNDTSGRDEWHAYQAARGQLAALGLDPVVDFCVGEQMAAALVPDVVERALLQEWADHQIRTDPFLTPLRMVGPDELAAEWQRLDSLLMSAAAEDVRDACQARHPSGDAGEAAVSQLQAALRKRMPVRELLAHFRGVAQAAKPCVLANPLGVSQHLPASMAFDVVIVDEASLLSPADALSCMYRGDALVLAGDQKQLPPARLGCRGGSVDSRVPAARAGGTSDVASVFDLVKESGVFGDLGLRWHYRSRHESLIAFSNAMYYQDRLVPLPTGGPEAGLALLYGKGVCRRGTRRDNPDEAARVAQRVIHHFDTRPDLSLGVVAFGQAQVDAIEAALGKAREQRPELDRFFTTDRLRGFFVKDVESVQGDERDVVVVSIGYGPDERGEVDLDFGPLSQEGGWCRLNVAVTRARYRTEVLSSICAEDIPEQVTADGLRHLRRYLSYAAQPR